MYYIKKNFELEIIFATSLLMEYLVLYYTLIFSSYSTIKPYKTNYKKKLWCFHLYIYATGIFEEFDLTF